MGMKRSVWGALRDTSSGFTRMRMFKPAGTIFVVWAVAMVSLLGAHYLLKRKPQVNKVGIQKIHARYYSLSDQEKLRMKYFESGIIELASGELLIVDGAENSAGDPITAKGLTWRRIAFAIEDPLLLERQTMIREALRTLNNAERHCFMDRHAAIIHQDGSYYLAIDPRIYADYVSKYGTECPSCGDREGNSSINPK